MASTLAQCQALVSMLATVAAEQVLEQSSILRVIYREYQQQVIAAAGTTTINLCTDAGADPAVAAVADTTGDVTFTLSVTRLLADPRYFTQSVALLARLLADKVDANLLGEYPLYTVNAPVGAAGTTITDAVVASAASTLDAVSMDNAEPRYLALKAANTYPNLLAVANAIDQTKAGAGSVNSDFLLNRLPKWRGFTLIPSNQVPATGSGPTTTHNLAFTPTAMGLVTVQRALTNDSTHVQAYSASNDGTLGIVVYLAFNGSNDAQAMGFGLRWMIGATRPSFAVQVNS